MLVLDAGRVVEFASPAALVADRSAALKPLTILKLFKTTDHMHHP